jgi:hypothetical protein
VSEARGMSDAGQHNHDLIEEYYGQTSTGNSFDIDSNGSIRRNSVQKSFKSIKDVFKVNRLR